MLPCVLKNPNAVRLEERVRQALQRIHLPCAHSTTCSLTHPTHSPTHSLTRSPTHPLTQRIHLSREPVRLRQAIPWTRTRSPVRLSNPSTCRVFAVCVFAVLCVSLSSSAPLSLPHARSADLPCFALCFEGCVRQALQRIHLQCAHSTTCSLTHPTHSPTH